MFPIMQIGFTHVFLLIFSKRSIIEQTNSKGFSITRKTHYICPKTGGDIFLLL